MKLTTLLFCLSKDEILLAMKKVGFGAGKWNGVGGKLESGESPKEAIIRETNEEIKIKVSKDDLRQVAVIDFFFDGDHIFECHVFLTKKWRGEPSETEEMRPQWFPLGKLPFNEMWVADARWIPEILKGKTFRAKVIFNKAGDTLKDLLITETIFS